jgi:hypothetical protein
MPDSRSSPTVLHDALAPEVRTDRLRPGWLVGMKAFNGTTTYRFMELNRPEQALDFYERALKPASAVPEPNFGTFSPESAVGLHSYLGASMVRRIPHGRPRSPTIKRCGDVVSRLRGAEPIATVEPDEPVTACHRMTRAVGIVTNEDRRVVLGMRVAENDPKL